jgi:hypothetical protein
MRTVLEAHLGFAFFVFLMGLLLGWVQLGRRVVVAVIGIQILLGIIVAALAGAHHIPLPGSLWVHIVGALLAMAFYIVARRVVDRSPENYRVIGWGLSLIGLALIVFTIWYGVSMYRIYGTL